MQIFSSDAVNTGVGVYWMFYSGGSFEEAEVPAGFPAIEAGSSAEGLRYNLTGELLHWDAPKLDLRSLKTLLALYLSASIMCLIKCLCHPGSGFDEFLHTIKVAGAMPLS